MRNDAKRWGLSLLLSALLLLFFAGAASSAQEVEERILSFDSVITVHRDSTMTVQETIRVLADGRDIRHGIYRDFPTIYRDKFWNRSTRGFRVEKVLMDGRGENFTAGPIDNGIRVKIGDANVLVSPGEHTYTLRYRTDRQLGYFPDHDELYWNVTGNGWQFPIDKATATVELPEAVRGKVLSVDGYTGPEGAKGRNFTAATDSSGRRTFSTVSPLGQFEGLTIVVSWPKGFVKAPTQKDKLGFFLRDNADLLWGVIGLLAVLAYYLAAWLLVGRDPAGRSIVVEYTPPEGISPAAMRFISKMRYDDRVFASAVINMAVKGLLKIKRSGASYTLSRVAEAPEGLSEEEHTVWANLLSTRKSLVLSDENYRTISKSIDDLKALLKSRVQKDLFSTNRPYLIGGLVLSLFFMFYSFTRADVMNCMFVFMILFFSALFTGTALMGIRKARQSGREEAGRHGVMSSVRKAEGGASAVLYGLLLTAAVIGGLFGLSYNTSPLYALTFLGFPVAGLVFQRLLKAPTKEGGILRGRIEGFRTFLAATEEDRLNRMNPPEMTPGLFEKYLPYALALDVEQQWAEQFSGILSEAQYKPEWCSGTIWDSADITRFSSSLGSSLSESISSSSTPPGSTSGSGGGGSSGGGGGGGGGGGW